MCNQKLHTGYFELTIKSVAHGYGLRSMMITWCFIQSSALWTDLISLPNVCVHATWPHNTLQWRHIGCNGVSNHQPHDCLLNRLFRRRSKKISKLCVTGLCEGNSPVTGEFPTQRASNTENVSTWWRYHEISKVWPNLNDEGTQWYLAISTDDTPVNLPVSELKTVYRVNFKPCVVKTKGMASCINILWWRHQRETFSTLLTLCAGN